MPTPAKKTPTTIVTRKPAPLATLKAAASEVAEGLTKMAQLLSDPNLSSGALALAFHVVDKEWKNPVETLREEARQRLLALAADDELRVDYASASYTVRNTPQKTLDVPQIEAACLEKGINYQSVCDAEIIYKPNVSKLKAAGFTDEQIEAMKRVKSNTLKVEKI